MLGQSIVIENRGGGAGGSIGAKVVAGAEPDGYTILLTPGGALTNGPAVHRNIGYDPARAFTPVALLITAPLILTVHSSLPVNTVGELVAYARTHPGKVVAGSQGYGTGPHLLIELLKLETGANIVHVPYRGSAPAIIALAAGEIQMFFDSTLTILPPIQSGKARALAISSKTRLALVPDVPTVAESAGVPGFEVMNWQGLIAPKGTPRAIIDKLNAAANQALKTPDLRQKITSQGNEPIGGTPEEFAALIKSESQKWGAVVKKADIKPE